MKKLVTLLLLIATSFLYADTPVGNVPTMGNKGLISVWADGSSTIHISIPIEGGFSINRNQLSDFVNHITQFEVFIAKAQETKINYTDTLLSTACSVVAPGGGKVYLYASSNADGTSYLGIELVRAQPGYNFGNGWTFWLTSDDARKFKSLLLDALQEDGNIANKLSTMRLAAIGNR